LYWVLPRHVSLCTFVQASPFSDWFLSRIQISVSPLLLEGYVLS
jgi:hypothetical protein